MSLRAAGAMFLLFATAALAENRAKVRIAVTCSPEGKLETIRIGSKAPQRIEDEFYEQVIARNLPDKRAAIVLSNDVATPYRCIGGFLYTLQHLGYRHVGFTSEPPVE